MSFNTYVPVHSGRLYTDSDQRGKHGNWVRFSEVNALQDEIRRLEHELASRERMIQIQADLVRRINERVLLNEERVRYLESEQDRISNGLFAQLLPGSSSQ